MNPNSIERCSGGGDSPIKTPRANRRQNPEKSQTLNKILKVRNLLCISVEITQLIVHTSFVFNVLERGRKINTKQTERKKHAARIETFVFEAKFNDRFG